MSFPHITPTKLRPFLPFVSPHNRKRSISPPPNIDTGVNTTPLPSSSGMFLLIRNVLPNSKTGFAKPVALIKEAVDEILDAAQWKDLIGISVNVLPGGRSQDPHSSSAYLELTQHIKSLDTIPRPDLLLDWKNALIKVRPSWDVVWAPQNKGKDRRMVVRFRVAESKEKVPAGALDKIRVHLESKGHRTTGGYVSFNGLIDITLADTNSVDTILASSYYVVPSLSKEGIHVSPPRFIPINNPFELCIGGLNEYDGLQDVIEKWLYFRYAYDDPSKTTRVFDTRVSPDREFFIFAMDSWESTLIVLKDIVAYRAYFAHSPYLTDPKLLFDLNSNGFGRKSTTSTIDAGAGVVNDAITSLKRDLADFRKEQAENNSLVQRQVSTIRTDMESQTKAVAAVGYQLQQFGLSLLAGRDEKLIEARISAIDSSIVFETQCLRTMENPADKSAILVNIATLQNDRREQTLLLAKATDTTVRLIGPAPGTLIAAPNPHPQTPTKKRNTVAPPSDNPSSLIPPATLTAPILPSSAALSTALVPAPHPITPAKKRSINDSTTNHAPLSPPTPQTPTPSTLLRNTARNTTPTCHPAQHGLTPPSPTTNSTQFNFGPDSMPAPIPFANIPSTKRTKTFPMPELPAKRARPSVERTTVTRSSFKSASAAQASDGHAMDQLDDNIDVSVNAMSSAQGP